MASEWPDSPQVRASFQYMQKAAVAGATTTDTAWAGALAQAGLAQEMLTIARDVSIVGAAESRMRRVPPGVPVPRQLDAGAAGGWVPEGMSIGAVAYAFDTLVLYPRKVQTFTVVSREVFRAGPSAQPVMRQVTIEALMRRIDALFLDPTQTDPASITANGTEITSTGTAAAQIAADLEDMLAAVTTSGVGLVWIMGRLTAAHVALMLAAAAADLPRTLLGVPVILSGHAAGQITLVDLAEVAYADEGGFAVSLSQEANVQMLDDPTNSSATATATSTVSLFQSNSVGIRSTRWLAWEVVRTGGSPAVQPVVWMTVTY